MASAIKRENIASYFRNDVCSFHANYLDNNCIKAYHAYAYQTYKVHN